MKQVNSEKGRDKERRRKTEHEEGNRRNVMKQVYSVEKKGIGKDGDKVVNKAKIPTGGNRRQTKMRNLRGCRECRDYATIRNACNEGGKEGTLPKTRQ